MKMNKNELPKSENKRGRLDIIIDILEVAKEGTSKTAIVSGANLNFQLTEKYLFHSWKMDSWRTGRRNT